MVFVQRAHEDKCEVKLVTKTAFMIGRSLSSHQTGFGYTRHSHYGDRLHYWWLRLMKPKIEGDMKLFHTEILCPHHLHSSCINPHHITWNQMFRH